MYLCRVRICHCSPTVDDAYIHIKICANLYVTSFKGKREVTLLVEERVFQSTMT